MGIVISAFELCRLSPQFCVRPDGHPGRCSMYGAR
jgi:hypothetical protein